MFNLENVKTMKKLFVLLTMLFAVAVIPAHAQLGGIIGRAVSKGVEKVVQKEADKQAEKIAKSIEEEAEKQAEKQAAKLDSINQAVQEANDALNEEQEKLEKEQQAAKDKNAGKKTTVDISKYDAVNKERKAANAKLSFDKWDY